MSAMYSQCPHCLTIYRVALGELAGGRGEAACGSCDQAFDVLATLSAELPPEPIDRLDVVPPQMPVPVLRQAVLRPKPLQPSLFDPNTRKQAESFLKPRAAVAAAGTRRRVALWLAVVVLAVVLLAQIVYAERQRLLAIPTYRAWAESLCERFGCLVPGSTRAIADIRLISRDIRKHPTVEGALLITATMANTGERARPYPILELRLSDLDERPVAMRRFMPEDYLSDRARVPAGMPPHSTVPLEFEVLDPGADAVAFEFRFLPPR
ncbi:zinc-ribbon and DUF3426 domain-containing protein [Pseudofulvimonas gallinarii]|jgi:predicted Zn finger-like uncharacterized protein|uniref:Putative Zn finger-like uncharacterized protein n=2 Tax=Pseudofulvimonas gallinarii TaxID=634155 RepID=A0A4S3KV72_9GAMM|nr:zinc-ribbon and DUF3426 domain-containing protein [Pseudofulvimonas gallinarii]TCS97978.1 putative Zn finger-like uncharacterized protein [Pseudofulvimonas gallinarii]THD13132.1 hypothetical protein B1808_09645 [Pseudofulvimonas gallinarii]